MKRAVTRCSACQQNILTAFSNLVEISRPLLPSKSFPVLPSVAGRYVARQFGTSLSRHVTSQSNQLTDTAPGSAPSDKLSDASVPWYLRVQIPEPPSPITPSQALQDLPPIPSDAPTILTPIVAHLSETSGLDNLTLLDLRSLDPPPALGANLIMVLGTARSYKHLNTSADRFCRWIRSRYKLHPYADGLLGRNELKLKLRRRARRMKLAQSVGAAEREEGRDDGITTGWICVNLGDVSLAKLPEAESQLESQSSTGDTEAEVETSSVTKDLSKGRKADQEFPDEDEEEYVNPSTKNSLDDDFSSWARHRGEGNELGITYAGFGSRSGAPRIVVQMFTEEKRVEMDLEGLYDFRAERRARKREANSRGFEDVDAVVAPAPTPQTWARTETRKEVHEEVESELEDEVKRHPEVQGGFKPWAL